MLIRKETLEQFLDKWNINKHNATRPYMAGCFAANFTLLCIVRATGTPDWIIGFEKEIGKVVAIRTREIVLLSLAGVCMIGTQFAIRIRSSGFKVYPCTWTAFILSIFTTIFLMSLCVEFTTLFPINEHYYGAGGGVAAITATFTSFVSTCLLALDVFIFHVVCPQLTLEQKKFEFANFLFVLYIILGSLLFTYLEPWSFERAGQFCLMTLLTIGYGDIVPVSFWGRMITILYTLFGLALAGFYIVAFEDIVTGEANMKNTFEIESSVSDDDSISISEVGPNRVSIDSTATQQELPQKTETSWTFKGIWKFLSVCAMLMIWWLGFAYLFYRFEPEWTFFESVYYAFVTMTGIGFGDFRVGSPVAVEIWWVFLFHAISIIAYIISAVSRLIGHKVIQRQLDQQKVRLVRQWKRKKEKDRIERDLNPLPLSWTHSLPVLADHNVQQTFPPRRVPQKFKRGHTITIVQNQ